MTIAAHTLVKNGMPLIVPVIKNVVPYVDRCLITISEKSNDGTTEALQLLLSEFPDKIEIYSENVGMAKDLTKERQNMLDRTTEDWIMVLDDDDWWPKASLEAMVKVLEEAKDVDGFCVPGIQVLDKEYADYNWRKSYLTKFLRNQDGLWWRNPWPKDLPYYGGIPISLRWDEKAYKLPFPFLHLAEIKPYSFRKSELKLKYQTTPLKTFPIPKWLRPELERIYKCLS